jgi:hypothetical protein
MCFPEQELGAAHESASAPAERELVSYLRCTLAEIGGLDSAMLLGVDPAPKKEAETDRETDRDIQTETDRERETESPTQADSPAVLATPSTRREGCTEPYQFGTSYAQLQAQIEALRSDRSRGEAARVAESKEHRDSSTELQVSLWLSLSLSLSLARARTDSR